MADWIEVLETEIVTFLKQIEFNAAHQRSNKLADLLTEARKRGARGVDRVLPFLRRNQFLSLDREARLALTPRAVELLDDEGQKARTSLRESLERAFPNKIAVDELAPIMSKVSESKPSSGSRRPDSAAGIKSKETSSKPTLTPNAGRAQQISTRERTQALSDPSADFEIDESLPSPLVRTARTPSPMPRQARDKGTATSDVVPVRVDRHERRPISPDVVSSAAPRNQVREPCPTDRKNHLDKDEGTSSAKTPIGPRYARYDTLGRGPLCTVFRGRQSTLGIDVAIKELQEIAGYLSFIPREALLERLQKCLMNQASLRHPCIAAVLDIELTVARPYFVLEFCPGGNLRQKMDESDGGSLELEEVLRIFGQLVHALQFMHAQGFTHGNLKPENLLFDRFGNAKLSDQGHAQLTRLENEKGLPRLLIGTGGLDYVCREKLRGMDGTAAEGLRLGITADLYGAGVLFYEMLTGRLPGVRAPLPSELNKHVPASVDTIFERLTTGLESSRFQSCAEVIAALRDAGDLPVRFDGSEVLLRTVEKTNRDGVDPNDEHVRGER